jgi:hypothetical protein
MLCNRRRTSDKEKEVKISTQRKKTQREICKQIMPVNRPVKPLI